jgi:hypothetical protein
MQLCLPTRPTPPCPGMFCASGDRQARQPKPGRVKETKHCELGATYHHDVLNRTDEETEELEDQVLLLLLHLVETVLATAGDDLSLGKTKAAVGLEHVLGDGADAAGGDSLLIVVDHLVAILGLEVLDQGVDVLILVIVDNGGLLLGGRDALGSGGAVGSLLVVEATRLNVGVQRRSAGGSVISHGERNLVCWCASLAGLL